MDWITVFEALKNIYIDKAYSNMAINEAVNNHNGCSPAFVRMFVKGVIRDSLALDYIIDDIADSGVDGIKNRTLIILRMGIYAIASLDSVPDYAAVNESVKLAQKVSKGSDKFVNAVLRNYIRNRDNIFVPKDNLSLIYSFPESLVDLIKSQYGKETEKILSGLNNTKPLTLRANLLKNSAEDVADYLSIQGIKAKAAKETDRGVICENGNILGTPGYKSGMFSVQSLSSMIAVEKLSPKPGSKVLDMCAAPGGKTAAMAEIMENKGEIIACDIHPHKIDVINAAMRRLELDIVKAEQMDGTIYNDEYYGEFDYVLADVPCSGLGVIPNKPEIKLRTEVVAYPALIKTQKSILKNAIRYTKAGGYIEYSTCTINKDENEGVINDVLNDFNNVQIIEKNLILPYNNLTGFFYCIMQKEERN